MGGTLAERLISLREHFAGPRGQRKFAQLVGIKQQSISNYERGAMPSAEVLARIVRATGCSADWLLTGRSTMFGEGDAREIDFTPPDATFQDEAGRVFTIEEVAAQHTLTPKKVTKLARDILGYKGQDKIPGVEPRMGLVDAEGRMTMYRIIPPPPPPLNDRVRLEVTANELQVHVPRDVLFYHHVRIVPEAD